MNILHLFVFKHAFPLVPGSRHFLIYSVEPVVNSCNFHLKLDSVIHKNGIEPLHLAQNLNGPHIEFQLLNVCRRFHHILLNFLKIGPRKWMQAPEIIGGHSHHRFVQELVVHERSTLIVRHLFYLAEAVSDFNLELLQFCLPRFLNAGKRFRFRSESLHDGLYLGFDVRQGVDATHFALEDAGAHAYGWESCARRIQEGLRRLFAGRGFNIWLRSSSSHEELPRELGSRWLGIHMVILGSRHRPMGRNISIVFPEALLPQCFDHFVIRQFILCSDAESAAVTALVSGENIPINDCTSDGECSSILRHSRITP